MFSHQGPSRTPRQNRLLAGHLAFVAGWVNAAGFVLLGLYTSHVTGGAGRFADELVHRRTAAAGYALLLILTFFVGGFSASTLLQSPLFRTPPLAYATALLLEAALLALFPVLYGLPAAGTHALRAGLAGAALSLAMGMQNSLVTLISDARVRTTHLTGVTTDLSIELARWWRWARRGAGKGAGSAAPTRPSEVTALLLSTIVASFLVGAVAGTWAAGALGAPAMLVAAAAVLCAALFALSAHRRKGSGR